LLVVQTFGEVLDHSSVVAGTVGTEHGEHGHFSEVIGVVDECVALGIEEDAGHLGLCIHVEVAIGFGVIFLPIGVFPCIEYILAIG
jgi:hypothetical protein